MRPMTQCGLEVKEIVDYLYEGESKSKGSFQGKKSTFILNIQKENYESRLQSSWTHLITASRNFVKVRWRSLFGKRRTSYNAPPTSRKRTADRWSLRNFLPRSSLFMVGETQKSHGPRSEWNFMLVLEKVDRWNPIRTSAIQSRSRPMRFLGFSNRKRGAPRQEISKWSTVCSTFSRSGWSVVRSASLVKGGT
jgi:hypothetical protein